MTKGCVAREVQDLQDPVFWRDVVIECLCSFILIFFLAANQLVYSDDFKVTPTHLGLVMGFTVFCVIEMFGHMSGAHMNPSVTLLFLCKRDITFVRAIFYMISQVAGGAAGAATIYSFASEAKKPLFHPILPAEELTLLQVIGIEICLTFFLCTVIQGTGDKQERAAGPCPMASAPVGMIVAADIMIACTWSGSAMNPLIPLGPSVITGNFQYHWIYWVGPFIGSLLSFLVYSGFSLIQRKYGREVEEKNEIPREKLEEMAGMLTGLLSGKQKEANSNTLYLSKEGGNSDA